MRHGPLMAAACLITLPLPAFADDGWLPDRVYCFVAQESTPPEIGLCHDRYTYMTRDARKVDDIVTFEKGVLPADHQRPQMKLEHCITRADLSLICAFSAVSADD